MQRSEPGGVLVVRRGRRLRPERSKCTPENRESAHPWRKQTAQHPTRKNLHALAIRQSDTGSRARTLAASEDRTPPTHYARGELGDNVTPAARVVNRFTHLDASSRAYARGIKHDRVATKFHS